MDLERVERELAVGQAAWVDGNDGKARVCARRAVGAAMSWLLAAKPAPGWGSDAMSILGRLQADPAFPDDVRAAAERLTTSVRERAVKPFADDPLADAARIIAHLRALHG